MKCSICGKEFEGYGNNPAPLKRGKCCDDCNLNVVLPLRMALSPTNKNRLVIIETDGTVRFSEENKITELKELQALVDGYIEVHPMSTEDFIYLVDEEGLIKGKEFNEAAYEILRIEVVGTVVIVPGDIFE